MPMYNLTEHYFNCVKTIEKQNQVQGDEWDAMMSLCESVEKMRDKNWSSVLSKQGYI